MNNKQLTKFKRVTELYWLSVIVVFLLFFETTFGYYYSLAALVIFAIHLVEIPVFNNILVKYSPNPMKDRFSMLLYGYTIPKMLKNTAVENQKKAK